MAINTHGLNGNTLLPSQLETPTTTTSTADFSQLGAVFNDATRALVGGLWHTATEEAGQGNGTIFSYINDLLAVHGGIQTNIDAGLFTGATLANAQTILNDITTAVTAAKASITDGGTFGSVAAAESALHNSHLDILTTVAGDANLSQMATKDGATGFMAVPPTLDGVNAHNAPHANLAEIGAIFDDAANRILGGVNAENKNAISNDIHAAITGMKHLIGDQPDAFSGLTGIHADAVMRQLQLELSFIKQADTNPVAGASSNNNILDIIDIIHNDPNLAQMASQNGVSGFTPFPDALNPTPKYLDNQGQTDFLANFIADSNSLGQHATQIVGNGDKAATHALISELKTFEQNATQFDAAQGGIFEARFDNELLGKTSTLGAEVHAMIKGLKTGDATLVAAAAEEMHTNAADVGGNNGPITGGNYNANGLSAEEVLTATPALADSPPAVTTVSSVTAAPTSAASGGMDASTMVHAVSNVATTDGATVTKSVEHVTPSVESVTQSAGHVTQSVEPVPPSIEPVTKSVGPIVTPSVEHITKSVEHIAPSVEPVTSSAGNVTKSVEHVTPSVEPVTPSIEPVTKLVEPVVTPSVGHVTPSVEPATSHHLEHMWG